MNGEMMEYMVGRRGIPMDVLTRMKIEERLEFLPQTGKEEACICFPYLEDGVMKNMKFRDAAKHFKMVKGAELIPWNIDAIKGKEKCYITEGEIDALSLIAAGLEEVVSVPNGAGGANLQWLDRFVESHFDDKTEIILAMDTDRRGVELRDELVRRLGVDRCKVVAWGEGCKDANEYLLKYDLPRLRQQVEQAAEIPLEGVFCPMDEWDTLMDIYYNGMPEGADTGLENLDRLIKFERGFVLTVTGVPGSGKSEFVDEIAMRLLLRHDWKVGYFKPGEYPAGLSLPQADTPRGGQAFRTQGDAVAGSRTGHPLPGTECLLHYAERGLLGRERASHCRPTGEPERSEGAGGGPLQPLRASDSRLGNGNAVHQPHLRRVLQFCREAQGVAHSGGAPHQVTPRTGKQTLACAHAV